MMSDRLNYHQGTASFVTITRREIFRDTNYAEDVIDGRDMEDQLDELVPSRYYPESVTYDMIAIGCGPAGLAFANAASDYKTSKASRLAFLVIDKGRPANTLSRWPKNMKLISQLSWNRLPILDISKFNFDAYPTVAQMLEYYRACAENILVMPHIRTFEEVYDVEIIPKGFLIKAKSTVRQMEYRYYTKSIVFATGFYDNPNGLAISEDMVPGIKFPKVIHHLQDFCAEPEKWKGKEVLVVGGGVSAVEQALAASSAGANVTVCYRGKAIKHVREKIDLAGIRDHHYDEFLAALRKGKITAYFNSQIKRITPKEAYLACEKNEIVIPNDWVLCMLGFRSDIELIQRIGGKVDPTGRPIFDKQTHELIGIQRAYVIGTSAAGSSSNSYVLLNIVPQAYEVVDDYIKRYYRKMLYDYDLNDTEETNEELKRVRLGLDRVSDY